jgi:SAM-dependent methyltransferase
MGGCVGKNHRTEDDSCNLINNANNKILYKYIDGRKFINVDNCEYPLPTDDEEVNRLQLQHYLYRYAWGRNFSSPVEDLLCNSDGNVSVLDVGCGPATFLLEMASDYPQVNFTGIDISPVFPLHIKPSNIRFMQMNIINNNGLCQLPFNDNTFDFVYLRSMGLSFKEDQWSSLLMELCRIMKHGSWIELMEHDVQFHNEGEISTKMNESIDSLLKSLSINPIISQHLPQLLSNTNQLMNLKRQQLLIPCGSWGGRLGDLVNTRY